MTPCLDVVAQMVLSLFSNWVHCCHVRAIVTFPMSLRDWVLKSEGMGQSQSNGV